MLHMIFASLKPVCMGFALKKEVQKKTYVQSREKSSPLPQCSLLNPSTGCYITCLYRLKGVLRKSLRHKVDS